MPPGASRSVRLEMLPDGRLRIHCCAEGIPTIVAIISVVSIVVVPAEARSAIAMPAVPMVITVAAVIAAVAISAPSEGGSRDRGEHCCCQNESKCETFHKDSSGLSAPSLRGLTRIQTSCMLSCFQKSQYACGVHTLFARRMHTAAVSHMVSPEMSDLVIAVGKN